MDMAIELEERNLAWKEGGEGNFQRSGGVSKGTASYRSPRMTRTVAGPSSALYGKRGDRAGAEGAGERRKAELRKGSQKEWQERQHWELFFKCGD